MLMKPQQDRAINNFLEKAALDGGDDLIESNNFIVAQDFVPDNGSIVHRGVNPSLNAEWAKRAVADAHEKLASFYSGEGQSEVAITEAKEAIRRRLEVLNRSGDREAFFRLGRACSLLERIFGQRKGPPGTRIALGDLPNAVGAMEEYVRSNPSHELAATLNDVKKALPLQR